MFMFLCNWSLVMDSKLEISVDIMLVYVGHFA